MAEMQGKPIEQNVFLENRTRAKITGVTDVVRFDEYEICIITENGELSIEGEELKISLLSVETGIVEVEGKIGAVIYADGGIVRKKGGLFFRK